MHVNLRFFDGASGDLCWRSGLCTQLVRPVVGMVVMLCCQYQAQFSILALQCCSLFFVRNVDKSKNSISDLEEQDHQESVADVQDCLEIDSQMGLDALDYVCP